MDVGSPPTHLWLSMWKQAFDPSIESGVAIGVISHPAHTGSHSFYFTFNFRTILVFKCFDRDLLKGMPLQLLIRLLVHENRLELKGLTQNGKACAIV